MVKVCVELCGGLGNQLFQYAAGRSLAKRLNAELYLDLAHFEVPHKKRDLYRSGHKKFASSLPDYELREAFGLQTPTCKLAALTLARIQYFLLTRKTKILPDKLIRKLCYKIYGLMCRYTLLGYKFLWTPYTCLLEPHFHYMTNWTKLSGNIYLKGYWQSERYFSDISSELRKEFSLTRFEDNRTATLLSKIKQSHSVSVHFRRGDFLMLGRELSLHYYTRALELLQKLVRTTLRLYIFSDDAQELKTLLPEVIKDTHLSSELVSGQGYSSYEEMMMISCCQHHIIANSTYSWWSVWLHDRSADDRPGEKYVIAPRVWYQRDDLSASHNTKDIYCDGWILV